MTAEETGVRVQAALDRLTGTGGQAAAEELVRELMRFYGDGLDRIIRLLPDDAVAALLDDPVVAGQLVLHDLHPEDVAARIARALASLPEDPLDVEVFDPDTGTLRLRATGAGCGSGCGSTREATLQAARDALACHAPEVTEVDLAAEPTLLQIGTRPSSLAAEVG